MDFSAIIAVWMQHPVTPNEDEVSRMRDLIQPGLVWCLNKETFDMTGRYVLPDLPRVRSGGTSLESLVTRAIEDIHNFVLSRLKNALLGRKSSLKALGIDEAAERELVDKRKAE